jgi:uncharacterized protein (TIRG00374 family)
LACRTRALAGRLLTIVGGHPSGTVFKLGLSLGLIVLVCRGIDGAALVRYASGQSPSWIAATVLLGLLQIGLLSLRWQMILRALGARSGLVSALAVTFMGCFFGSFMFGPTGGDVARAVLAPPRALGRTGIVHSVVFERFASTIGLGLAAAPVVGFGAATMLHGVLLVIASAMIPLPFAAMAAIGALARRLGDRQGRICQALRALDDSLRQLYRRWPRFALAVAIATVGQLLVAVEAWSLAQAQHLDVSLIAFAILMPPVMLVVALPISAGGWGVREGALVAALALVGVDRAAALLLSVELGVIGTLVALPGGALWLHRLLARSGSANSVA